MDFPEQFLGREWLDEEVEKVNTKSPLKGAGTYFRPYHPWAHYRYGLEYILKHFHLEKRESAVTGEHP